MIIIAVYLFVLGMCFGSFALAMVDRMHAGKDWVKGRSECEYCKHALRPVDLVPLFSWVSVRGKCRYCRHKLSISYPVTEAMCGTLYCFSYVFWPTGINTTASVVQFIIWLLALVIIVALFIYDMRWYILPNKLVYPLIVLGACWVLSNIYIEGLRSGVVLSTILAIAVGSGIFALLYFVSNGKWIGFGDVRLGIAIGLFAGSPVASWLVIFIASIVGIAFSIPILLKSRSKNKMKLKIPFGPLLLIGLFIVVIFGSRIINWYQVNVLLL